MSNYNRSGKNDDIPNIHVLGLSGGLALVLGMYLLDMLMSSPPLG